MKLHLIQRGSILAAASLCSIAAFTGHLEAAPRFEAIQAFQRHPVSPTGQLASDAAGNFYGSSTGGAFGCGAIFKISPDGTMTTLHHSDSIHDEFPGDLIAGADGNFYGTSFQGGSHFSGNIFRITPAGEYTLIHEFTGGAGGGKPGQTLLLSPRDGNFYGFTTEGGANGLGTFFRMTPAGVLTTLYSWGNDAVGSAPSHLVLGREGYFYGLCQTSSNNRHASIWRITTSGAASSIANFASLPNMRYALPSGLMQASDGNFYGTTSAGGPGDGGTIFKVSPPGVITLIAQFDWYEHVSPCGNLVEAADGMLYGTAASGGPNLAGQVFRIGKSGGFVALADFDRLSGGPAYPLRGMTLQPDGSFVGLTTEGGIYHCGAAFRMSPGGDITTFASFKGDRNCFPGSKLLLASDGSFHGKVSTSSTFKVTPQGELDIFSYEQEGAWGLTYNTGFVEGNGATIYGFEPYSPESEFGFIYTLNSQHERETFYTFDGVAGGNPNSLISGPDGSLYGTTHTGGSLNGGTIYKLDSGGVSTVLAEFDPAEYSQPAAGLVRTSDGTIYGTTELGGPEGDGSVFKLGANGVLTSLADFTSTDVDGRQPVSGLMEASDGNLYGVLREGGPAGVGAIYRITPAGEKTTLHVFDIADGAYPVGQLAEGPDGALYGATRQGGMVDAAGTLFRITREGAFTTIFHFDGFNGKQPLAGLTAGNDGALYGTTSEGGFTPEGKPAGGGLIFRIQFGAEVETGAATAIASSTATLNATVNPGGYATTVTFEYGTSPDLSSFSTVTAGTLPAGDETVNVTAELTGLVPGTTYYFRAVAANDETPEQQAGEIASFTTTDPAEIVISTNSGFVLSDGSILVFGLTPVGGSANLGLSIANTSSNTALTGVSATIGGSGAGHFSLTGVPADRVEAGSNTACAVRFQPASPGLKTANLTITSSDADESPTTIHFYGIGLPGFFTAPLGSTH